MTLGGELLEDLAAVGATGDRSVRFWARGSRPGRLELLLESDAGRESVGNFDLPAAADSDFTTSIEHRGLAPGTRYRWAIRRTGGGSFLGEGSFETAPRSEEAPDEMSIAVMSCHQPFDERGELSDRRLALLRAADSAFEEHQVKRVLMLGDQIYSDQPEHCSLFDPAWFRMIGPRGRPSIFDCSRAEVRQMYQHRYRSFWAMPELQRLMQRWPCCMMIDDHDICDTFGTRLEHGGSIWESVRGGAFDAAFDYQGSRTRGGLRPPSLHFQLEYGPIACFVMDLRSQRGWNAGIHRVYGEEQHRDLELFLEANLSRPVLLLGMSVPMLELDHQADADRWHTLGARSQRDRLLQLIAKHRRRNPEQKMVIASGDLHAGLVARLAWENGSCPPVYQLVASAMSRMVEPKLRGARHRIGADPPGARFELLHRRGMKNPCDGLNIGLVKVVRDREWKVKLVMLGLDDSSSRARVVYESEAL